MEKRITTMLILGIAAVLIVYVVINSTSNEVVTEPTETDQFLTGPGESESNERQADEDVIENDVPEKGIYQGNVALDFTLPLWQSDETRSLSDYRGEVLVLNMWASWCPPCRKEMPDFIQLYNDYKDDGVAVVGINMATVERNEHGAKEFMEEFQVNFPTLIDVDGEVADLYQVIGIPVTYVIDEDGIVYKRIMGAVTYDMLVEYIKDLQ